MQCTRKRFVFNFCINIVIIKVCKEDSPLGDTLMVWEALRNHLKQLRYFNTNLNENVVLRTIENQQGDIVRLAQLMLDDLTAKRWKNSFDNSSFLSAVFFDPTVIRYFTSSDPEAVTIDWQAISDEIRSLYHEHMPHYCKKCFSIIGSSFFHWNISGAIVSFFIFQPPC